MVMSKEALIPFLQFTLIPDLMESGQESTAEDFTLCVLYMLNPHVQYIDQVTCHKFMKEWYDRRFD